MSRLPILMRREGSHLVPIDAWSAEMIERLPEGVTFNVKKPTKATASDSGDINRDLLAVWWTGINELFENTDAKKRWLTPEGLSKYLLKEIGFVEMIPDGTGGFRSTPRSLSLDSLEDPDDRILVLEAAKAYCVAQFGWEPWQESRDKWEMKKRHG